MPKANKRRKATKGAAKRRNPGGDKHVSKADIVRFFSYLGKRRAKKLTPAERSESARKAAQARWAKRRKPSD